MSKFTWLLVSAVIALWAVFFRSDADLPLQFLRTPPKAYEDQVVWITGASSGLGKEFIPI